MYAKLGFAQTFVSIKAWLWLKKTKRGLPQKKEDPANVVVDL